MSENREKVEAEWPEPPKAFTARGALLVVVVLAISALLAVLAIYLRRSRTLKTLDFYGFEGVSLIQDSDRLYVWRPPTPTLEPRQLPPRDQMQDLSDLPGVSHLRAAFLDDRHYRWDTEMDDPQGRSERQRRGESTVPPAAGVSESTLPGRMEREGSATVSEKGVTEKAPPSQGDDTVVPTSNQPRETAVDSGSEVSRQWVVLFFEDDEEVNPGRRLALVLDLRSGEAGLLGEAKRTYLIPRVRNAMTEYLAEVENATPRRAD